MTGQMIAYSGVRVGDRVRVAWRENNIDYSAELTVAVTSGGILYPSERGGLGLGGMSVGGSRVITLLDRPPPSLLDRMQDAYYAAPGTREVCFARALAVIRADIVKLRLARDGHPNSFRAMAFDDILAHLTPEVSP